MIVDKDLAGRKISVIGAGVSGRAIAELAKKLGADVFVSDAKALSADTEAFFKKENISFEAEGNTEKLLDADMVIISSGISPDVPVLKEAVSRGVRLVGELDFVYPYLSGTIIAITGSNGKTTTASMTGYFLEQCGVKTVTAGNIGNPVAKAAEDDYDFIVLELSSFQLYWAEKFRCDVAIVTNLAPDHIDWHGSYSKYVEAKANIIRSLHDGGAAIFQERDAADLHVPEGTGFPLIWGATVKEDPGIYIDDSKKAAFLNGGNSAVTCKLFDFSSVSLLGTHNIENAAMSLAVPALFNLGEIQPSVISSYTPPKHRCAYAGEVKGITFVDDSKGTNVAASVTAMSSLPGTKVIILGGQGKGEDYAPLAEAVAQYTKSAVILGAEKEKIAAALDNAGYSNYTVVSTMEEAVKTAYSKACEGDTVLLSPACTSWDMYPNYGARGDHFCDIAKGIIEKEK
jgi:UDP-N-acetylmuramoylalanine--D-glutamate ligase